MSFREKIAWISLLATLFIYGGYFAGVGRGAGLMASLGMLIGATVLFVVVIVVLTVAAALFSPREASAPADEREKLIALKSTRAAYFVVSSGAVFAIGAVFLGIAPVLVANGLFLALVAGEFANNAAQIYHFRKGA